MQSPKFYTYYGSTDISVSWWNICPWTWTTDPLETTYLWSLLRLYPFLQLVLHLKLQVGTGIASFMVLVLVISLIFSLQSAKMRQNEEVSRTGRQSHLFLCVERKGESWNIAVIRSCSGWPKWVRFWQLRCQAQGDYTGNPNTWQTPWVMVHDRISSIPDTHRLERWSDNCATYIYQWILAALLLMSFVWLG